MIFSIFFSFEILIISKYYNNQEVITTLSRDRILIATEEYQDPEDEVTDDYRFNIEMHAYAIEKVGNWTIQDDTFHQVPSEIKETWLRGVLRMELYAVVKSRVLTSDEESVHGVSRVNFMTWAKTLFGTAVVRNPLTIKSVAI